MSISVTHWLQSLLVHCGYCGQQQKLKNDCGDYESGIPFEASVQLWALHGIVKRRYVGL